MLRSPLVKVGLWLLAAMLPYVAMAQTVTVVDNGSGRGIRNVFIYNKQKQSSVLTSSQGKADLSVFSSNDTLIFRHPTYEQLTYPKSAFDAGMRVVKMEIFTLMGSEFVIVDSKDSTRQRELPSSVEVITAEEIAFTNAPSTPDLLASTNGILVQKSQLGGGSPILRGFEANRILLVVDGVRMNNAIYRSGHLQNSLTIDNQILERTEVVFGPSSVIYGSDALGGVIHFVTRNPALSKNDTTVYTVNTSTRYSTADNGWSAHVDAGVGFKKFGFLTSVTSSSFGDLRMGSVRHPVYPDFGKIDYYANRINGVDTMVQNRNPNVHVNSGYTQLDFMEKVLYQPTDRLAFTLNLQYSTSSDIPRYDQLNTIEDGELRWAEWYYGPQDRLFGSFKTDWRADNKWFNRATVTAAAQDIEESRITRRFGNNDRTTRIEQVAAYSLNLDFYKDFSEHSRLQYGAEWLYNDVTSTAETKDIEEGTLSPAATRYPDGGAHMRTLAGYINFKTRLAENLFLNTGARYSHVLLETEFEDTTFVQLPFEEIYVYTGATNGRIGLSWMPMKTWRLRGTLASGFRAPNVDDNGKVFEKNGDVVVPNDGLKPEYVYTGEFGTTKTLFEDVLEVEGTFFYSLMRDAIVRRDWQLNGQDSMLYEGEMANIQTNINANRAVIYGYSLRGKVNILEDRLWASTTYNYTHGRDITDDVPLAHIPPSFGSLRATYAYNWFKSSLFVNYNGWKFIEDYAPDGTDNEDEATAEGAPSWYTLNLNTVFQVSEKASLQLIVENILDRHYKPFASGVSGPGRNFVISGRVAF